MGTSSGIRNRTGSTHVGAPPCQSLAGVADLRRVRHREQCGRACISAAFIPTSIPTSIATFTLTLALTFWLGLCVSTPTHAKEPATAFIAKLKERGYFDMVQEYSARLKDAGIKAEGMGSFESQQALVSAELASQERDPNKREKLMLAAKSQLSMFVSKSPKDPAVDKADEWIRKILFEQARVKVARAKLNVDDAKKREMLKEAVELFGEAQKAADAHVEKLKRRIVEFRKLPKEKQDSETRETNKTDYLQAKLTAATVLYESAAALEFDKAKRKERLTAAAAAGGKLTEDYPTFIAGFVGMRLKGRALRELGNYSAAIEVLTELAETDQPALRMLSADAVGQIIQCHNGAKTPDKGIEMGKKWLKEAGSSVRNDPAVQGLMLAMARAYGDKAELAQDDTQRKLTAEGRKLAMPIARAPGPHQAEAKEIVANFPGEVVAGPAQVDDLKTYADAKSAGDTAQQESQTARQTAALMKGKLARAPAAKRTEMGKEIAALESTANEESQKALQYYRQAIRLAPPETDSAEINLMRLASCFAYYGGNDFFSAAVVGEFLARRFPDGPTSRRGASIAMASYYKMFEEAQEGGSRGEAKSALRKLVSIANYLSDQWPDQPEAQQALITLVQFMIKQGQLDKAQEYLNKIPLDSPQRGQADLVTGQAIWSKYTEGIKAAEGVSNPELEKLKTRAQKVLQGGVDRMRKAGPSASLANAMLNLARIYNDSGDPKKALELLNDPKVGPKTLIDKKDPSVQAANFDSVTYKTTLQALLASIATAPDKTKVIGQAKKVMEGMKEIYGDSPKGKKRLIANFRAMAKELQEQLQLAPANQKAALASGIETFLLEVQKASNEFNVLYWVAETMYSLGESFLGANGKVTPAAKKYFDYAATAYTDILKRADAGQLKVAPNLSTQVRMKAASTKSRLGDHTGAIEDFKLILKQNEKLLSIQLETAATFKAAGDSSNDVGMYTKAIKGDVMNPNTRKNTLWGYERISQLTAPLMSKNPKMKETFFLSRYEIARCRFLQSKAAGDEKYLNAAKAILLRMQGSYPDLGGKDWKAKFEKLMKQVGVPPAGAPVATQ